MPTKKDFGSQQKENRMKFNSIKQAIEDIKKGKVIIVVDDENRENEGDFVAAAEMVTPEMINFWLPMERGLFAFLWWKIDASN